ncbi:OTU domain-containing protein 4 [Paramisgurnus dabryanus]|uniref:OTU domain-containing protein 4 n=1 Tax=Paramisgurnus dabryanus TaxID=90735 RepID=UPI0031F3B1E2
MENRRASADAQPQLPGDRTLECRMDEYLRSLGFYRKKIAKDGSCLFRAVAEQVLKCQALHYDVRMACVKYLRQNRAMYELFIEGDFEKYLENLQDPQSWVGQVEITALAELYKHDFIIFQQPDQPPVSITEYGFPDKVRLCFLNGNHYDSVYPQSFEKSAAVCQSILYELLYDRVCGADRSVLTPCMKGGRGRERLDSEECKSSEESDLEEDEFWSKEKTTSEMKTRHPARGRGRGRGREGAREYLSTKVKKSLNPDVYRNVEYDVWLRSKRIQQQRDFCMAAGMQYSVGDKCKVQLSGSNRFYSAYVQEVSADNGPVTVFIEELGRQHTVPLLNLRLSSEESESWQKVSEKSKRYPAPNNGHTSSEWENRGGRRGGRGGGSSSAPAGRVNKQHSWPPQSTADEQTGGRGRFRRSDQRSSPVCVVSQMKEENTLLELLHKDEHNFPSLGTAPQTVNAGEVIKRGGDKKSSRKKDHRGSVSETDLTEAPQKPIQGQESNTDEKHERKVTEEPEQRSSSAIKEKSVPASPAVTFSSAPKSAPVQPHTDTSAPPAPDTSASKAFKTTQNGSARSTSRVLSASQSVSGETTVPVSTPTSIQSTPVSISFGQIGSVLTAILPTAGPNSGSFQSTQAASQNTLVSSSASTQVIPVIPPTSVQAPALSVSAPNAPVKTIPPDSVSTPSAPVQTTAPESSTTPPTDEGSAPAVDVRIGTPTTNVPPTAEPAQAPTPVTFQSSLETSEPRPSESLAIPASGVQSAPDHRPQQLLYPPLQWSQLLQDPLYPGFPQNEKGEGETLPPFSLSRKGEDLPQDINVLRFFFNLGIKAYSQPLWPPISYLGPLTQAYQMHTRAPPPPSNSPSNPTVMTQWQPENPTPPQNSSSTSDTSLESHGQAPVPVGSGPVGSLEMGGYQNQTPPIQMQAPLRPAVHWSVSSGPSSYTAAYPVQFSSPPCAPPGNQMYPPSSVGYHHAPPGRMDVVSCVPPSMMRGQENGQRSMTTQFGSLQKAAYFPGGQPHLGGHDFNPMNIPVSMTTMELPSFGGHCPQPIPLQGDVVGLTSLANGNLGRQGDVFPMSLHAGDDPARLIHAYFPDGEQEFIPNVDLRVGQSFYSHSYKGGGRRGQDDRGGYRGRGYRGRKDYSGWGRPEDQPYVSKGHHVKRGMGPRSGLE